LALSASDIDFSRNKFIHDALAQVARAAQSNFGVIEDDRLTPS
jgi:hypothetical protein